MSVNNAHIPKILKQLRLTVGVVLILCLALAVLVLPVRASDVSLEQKIKAAFTYNFIKFIDWPGAEGSEDEREFVISVIGEGPINPALDELEKKEIFGKPLKVRHVDALEEAGHSNVYFINDSARGELDSIFEKARMQGILTVGDMDEFCDLGGIINFVILEDSIHFEINQKEALRAHLSISYKLLNQASRVIR